MQIENLATLEPNATIDTDLVIVGGGPAGLTIAREFCGSSVRVLVLESGQLRETEAATNLNKVESVDEPKSDGQIGRRLRWHGGGSSSWSQESQPYGVRCRVLGGSSHAWAGKVAAFDETDFAKREWIAHSGWPIELKSLDRYLERGGAVLNLGPNRYDATFWNLLGLKTPPVEPNPELFQSSFWQIARSRLNSKDIMRFGPEFANLESPNLRVLINATVTSIETNETGSTFEYLEVATIEGVRHRIRAKAAVLAASAIENPRLLLVSRTVCPNGLGNACDVVGRYLMDHVGARLGSYKQDDCAAVMKRFGFYSVRHQGEPHIYVHGLVPSRTLQERERLNNCAIYMLDECAIDDPWSAIKRLAKGQSEDLISDMFAVASSPGLLVKGGAMRVFDSGAIPEVVKRGIVNAVISRFPNFAVREFRTRSMPHKLKSVAIEGIAEQSPDPGSRITLSDNVDALGVPMPRVRWRRDIEALRSLACIAKNLAFESPHVGLPAPQLAEWVVEQNLDNSQFIDCAHTAGTTRMSEDPKFGVVDPHCRVHGVSGLYIAGASVFPTSGHANPTLMIVALAIRLADQIKVDLEKSRISATG
jgi:choline dehydrogenase-like flavoprotein